MIDIHTHCLPGIDDGAKDAAESLVMLKDSFCQGVQVCVATPHCVIHREDAIDSFLEARNNSYETLMAVAAEEQNAIPKLLLGGEVYMDNDLSQYPNIKKLCIGQTPYMLVELIGEMPAKTKADILYNLTHMGIKPIIAHIERYDDWQELLIEFSDLKILYQVNAVQFLSLSGKSFLKKFMKYGISFMVSSDMHNTSTRNSTMQKAYEKAKKKYGIMAEEMFDGLARKTILND